MPIESERGNLYITVVAGEGVYLSGVLLTIMHEATRLERVTVTNEEGQGRFRAIPTAGYYLRAELEGFNAVEKPHIVVEADQDTLVEIEMDPIARA